MKVFNYGISIRPALHVAIFQLLVVRKALAVRVRYSCRRGDGGQPVGLYGGHSELVSSKEHGFGFRPVGTQDGAPALPGGNLYTCRYG